jgi:serine/threonine protein kinase
MGEVYRAQDTKLKREVALKVSPDSFASDPERMVRFQREAEVLASLNHPNIAAIYGVEERALVMNWWKAPHWRTVLRKVQFRWRKRWP